MSNQKRVLAPSTITKQMVEAGKKCRETIINQNLLLPFHGGNQKVSPSIHRDENPMGEHHTELIFCKMVNSALLCVFNCMCKVKIFQHPPKLLYNLYGEYITRQYIYGRAGMLFYSCFELIKFETWEQRERESECWSAWMLQIAFQKCFLMENITK